MPALGETQGAYAHTDRQEDHCQACPPEQGTQGGFQELHQTRPHITRMMPCKCHELQTCHYGVYKNARCAYSQRACWVISKFRAAAPTETGGGFLHTLYKLLTAACEVHSIWFFTGQNCWCHTLALHSAWEAVLRYMVLWRVLHTQDYPCWCCSSHKNLLTLQSMAHMEDLRVVPSWPKSPQNDRAANCTKVMLCTDCVCGSCERKMWWGCTSTCSVLQAQSLERLPFPRNPALLLNGSGMPTPAEYILSEICPTEHWA